MTDVFSLSGKRALVTGASRGLGMTLATNLAGAGADVAICARQPETVTSLAERMTQTLGIQAVPVVMDMTDIASIREATALAARELGGLDILVNNAGVQVEGPALEVEEEDWDLVLDTNLKGAFFVAQAAARIMSEGRGGVILNICALSSCRGIPNAAPYGCSKSGLLGITRALAAEWGRYFIRVNALVPGYIHTDMTEHLYLDRDWRAEMFERTPISRLGQTTDSAEAAIFLVSDASRFITGACLPVDGGILATI
jgi:NAD(P)-dependent dehydrogenase (short-subunit alcohol dehydrogenase family)